MIKVKDGYAKLINTSYTGDISLVLLSNGGTIGYDVSTNTILATIGSNVASADKLKNKVKLWGLDFDGTNNISGSIVMDNSTFISMKDTGGADRVILNFDGLHRLFVGNGTSSAGYNTYIDGKNIYLRYGTSHTTGLTLDSGGTTRLASNLVLENDKAVYIKNSSGTGLNILYVDSSNVFHIGYATSGSYNTKICGNNLYLCYGSRSTGMILNNSGNLTIGSSDLASTTYKLYVNGMSYFNSQMNVVGNFYKYNAAKTYRLSFVNDSDYCSIYNIKADGSAYGNLVFQGNVGIGTTSPTQKLDVNGAMQLSGWLYANSYIWLNGKKEGLFMTADGLYWHDDKWAWKSDLIKFTSSSVTIGQSTTIQGNLVIPNAYSLYLKDKTGANIDSLFISNSNNFHIGYGASRHGYNTYLDGKNIELRYGLTPTTGLILNSSGNLTIGSSDYASTSAKLFVDGVTKIANDLFFTVNNAGVGFKDTGGTNRYSLVLGTDNILRIGSGIASAGYSTYLLGNAVHLRYGTSHSLGFILSSNGNVTIGSSDLASTKYKLYVNGMGCFSDTSHQNRMVTLGSGIGIHSRKDTNSDGSAQGITAFGYSGTNLGSMSGSMVTGDRLEYFYYGKSYNNSPLNIFPSGNISIGGLRDTNTLSVLGTLSVSGATTLDSSLTVNDNILATGGFLKLGSSNSYVLLGGGGHKLLSDLGTSDGTYLPLSGGTMTGKINFSADPSDTIWIGATAETSGSKSFLDFFISDDATDAFRWRTSLYKEGGNVEFTMMQLSGSNTGNATLALTGNMTATGGVTANKFVSGNGVNDFTAGTVKLDVLNIPTSNGGTTFGPGSNGLVLKSNGTTVYWASDSNSNTWRPVSVNGTSVATSTTGTGTLNIVLGTGITVSGAVNSLTITNAGVRSTTINGDYLRVNTNGTNNDLTIPYATKAGRLISNSGTNLGGLSYYYAGGVVSSTDKTGAFAGPISSTIYSSILRLLSHTTSGGLYYRDLIFDVNSDYIWSRRVTNSGDPVVQTLLHSGNTYINNGVITINGTSITPLTAHQSLANYVTLNSAQTISGVKTFSKQLKFTVTTGSPFTVSSTTKVSNLNADLLDGYHESKFPLLNGVKLGTWNWNDVLRAGYYKIQAGTITNHPSGIYQYGMAAVLTTENHADGENRELLLYYPHNQTNSIAIWGRMHNSSTQGNGWGPWWGIPNTEGVKQIINTYYWANVKVSSTSSTTTTPTFANTTVNGGLAVNGGAKTLTINHNHTLSTAWNDFIACLNPNLTATYHTAHITFGRTYDSKNVGYIGFKYAGSASNSNMVTIGLHSVDNVLNILASGNVGIGTLTPSLKLDVVGSIQSSDTVYGKTITAVGNTVGPYLPNINWFDLTKNVGFHVSYRLNETAKPLRFYYKNSDTFTLLVDITSSGSVGIGTTGPSYKLHVNGSVYGDHYYGNAITLYTRGSGNYNRAWISAKDDAGDFIIEAPLTTDSASGTRAPITLTWRGGFPSKGGLKITGKSTAQLGSYTILHTGNYTSYTVTKTGGGASGTWGINISGNASTATKATLVLVYQHTDNDVDYPLIWTNASNSNSVFLDLLYKSYNHLMYNPKYRVLKTGSLLVGSTIKMHTGDSALAIYSGRITDGKSDGNICFLTSIDNTDPQSHSYPTLYLSRCNISLLPRGGLVYIGTNPNGGNTSYKLYVAGNTYASGSLYAAHFYENSDIQLKLNIQEILNSDRMPIIKEFDWKESGEHSYGLIAQELEEQGYSELVSTKDDGYKTVNYSAALSLIVGKLQVKIKELEKEIEILKSK